MKVHSCGAQPQHMSRELIVSNNNGNTNTFKKFVIQVYAMIHVYVRHKAWIWTIHGLRCTKHGSALCTTIHRLPAQSLDRVNRRTQSMDLAKL